MAVNPATSESLFRPSNELKDFCEFISPGERIGKVDKKKDGVPNAISGVQDILETICNAFDWVTQLGFSEKFAGPSTTLEQVNWTLSIPAFFGNLGSLKDQVERFSNTDDSDAKSNIVNHTLLAGVHGAKSMFALDSWGLVSLKESMKTIKTTYWSCLLALDGIGLYNEIDETKHLQGELNKANISPERREIYVQKLQNSYLKVLQHAVVAVAMAPLCLISILFAGIAHGWLFHPAVMLSLSSVWCVLNFVTYFYDKAIERWEKKCPELCEMKA